MNRLWVALLLCLPAAADAQPAQTPIAIHVTEAGGIRRTQFPVTARVPFPRGVLRDPAIVKLTSSQADVPQQASAEMRWPDGSVRWLALELNVTIGPNESQTYSLQFGEGAKSEAAPRGLSATETADGIQVGNIRFSKSGDPLIASVKYREEAIGAGMNGLAVADQSGSHDLATAENVKVEIVKGGPLLVALRYSGTLHLDRDVRAPFTLDVEMPNSKSWIKLQAVVDDPGRSIRNIAIGIPLALGPFPWVWDFGTTRWTYGAIRAAGDSTKITNTVAIAGADWNVTSGAGGREQIVETSKPDTAVFNGWGHVQGAREVVAWAVEGMKAHPGRYQITFSGSGQTIFGFAPASPHPRHELTVYTHFVSTPVQIGAATSPAAILSPLIAVCDRDQYVKSGVPVPAGVN